MKKVLSLCSALLGKGMAAGLILLASHALAPLQMFAQDRNISLDIRESMDLRISPEQRHRIFRYMLRSLSLSFPGRLGSLEHGIWEL